MAVKRPSDERTWDLDGPNGNAFAVMGMVRRLVTQIHGKQRAEEVVKEMTSGDYLHLLQVADREVGSLITWVTDNQEYLKVLSA